MLIEFIRKRGELPKRCVLTGKTIESGAITVSLGRGFVASTIGANLTDEQVSELRAALPKPPIVKTSKRVANNDS